MRHPGIECMTGLTITTLPIQVCADASEQAGGSLVQALKSKP